jgi:hypothetical protein
MISGRTESYGFLSMSDPLHQVVGVHKHFRVFRSDDQGYANTLLERASDPVHVCG